MLSDFTDGFAKKLARGLDIMSFHGINPRTKQASAIIGDNCFDKKLHKLLISLKMTLMGTWKMLWV